MESRGASLSSERLRHRCITRAGAACQWGHMHGRATRCSLVAGVFLAATWTPTHAEPHCKVKGYYQATPFVFACDGSGGGTDTNKAKVLVPGNSLKDIATIPAGTQDFDFKVSGDNSAKIEIIDASIPKILVPDSLRKTGPGTWQGSHGDTTIRYTVSHAGERVTFSGTASTELKLGLKNSGSEDAEYKLGYYYFPFSSGPQCKLGGAPLGCKPFDQYTTQAQVTEWAKWLAGEHPDPNDAWEKVMNPLSEKHQGYAVPPYEWCKAWSQWPGAASSPTSCESAYKFVTGGGYESNVKDIYQTQFTWAHSLGKIAEFDHRCCTHIKKKYKHKDKAWDELKAIALSSGSESACDGLLEVCKKLNPVPPNRDYCLYLDADGYPGSGTVVIEDIAHCFGEVPTLPPEPKEAPMVEAPAPPLESQPEPEKSSGSHHFRHHPRPTPQPTPAPTPEPTPEPAPEPAPATTTPQPTLIPITRMVVSPTQENGVKVGVDCVLGPMIWIKSLNDNYLMEHEGEVRKLWQQPPAQDNWSLQWRLLNAGNNQVFILDMNGDGLSKADTGHYQVSANQGQWERWDFASAGDGYIYLTGGDSLQLQDAGGYARAASERGNDEKWKLTTITGDLACHPVKWHGEDKRPWFPTDSKRVGLMIGGGVAGALAAGAAVAGVGVLINQMKAGDDSKAQAMRTQGLPNFGGLKGITTTVEVLENATTTTSWVAQARHGNVFENVSGKSDNIMVPLIALSVVCVLGILLLGIAAYLDPCGGRKSSKRNLADQSNSVASVNSVETYDSEDDSRYMQSEEDDDYFDHEPGSSVAEWDYDQVSQTDYPQEPWPQTNLGGHNAYGAANGSPLLAGEQVKLAVFDFDLTLTRNHLWKMYTTRDLSRIPVYDDTFVDLVGFREFVNTASAVGCRVAIVTFGRKDVVKKAMSFALGDGSRIDVSSPQDLGLREGSDELGNKNQLLQRLAQRYNLKKLNQIVFVDDDPLHVRAAASIGVQAVPAPSGANRDVLRRVAATIQDRSPSYSVARR